VAEKSLISLANHHYSDPAEGKLIVDDSRIRFLACGNPAKSHSPSTVLQKGVGRLSQSYYKSNCVPIRSKFAWVWHY
jgi:hypothetical protein